MLSTLGSQAFGVVISVIFLAHSGRKLPEEEIALFAFVTTPIVGIELSSNLGRATLTIREASSLIAEGKRGYAQRLISSTLFGTRVLGTLVAVVLVLLAPVPSRAAFGTEQYVRPFRLMGGMTLISNMTSRASLMPWASATIPTGPASEPCLRSPDS